MNGPVIILIHITSPWHEATFKKFVHVDIFIYINALENKMNRQFSCEDTAPETITEADLLALFTSFMPGEILF